MGEHPRDTIYLYVEAERQAQEKQWGSMVRFNDLVALLELDPAKIRRNLVQAAAVAIGLIEALDRDEAP